MSHNHFQHADWYQATSLLERVASLRAAGGRPRDPSANIDLALRRMKRWRSQAPFASGSYFTQRLDMDGLTEDDLLYSLAEPAEAVRSRLAGSQAWLAQLFRQFSSPASQDPLLLPDNLNHQKTSGFIVAIAPMLVEARERVHQGAQELAESQINVPFESLTITEAFFASLAQQVLAMLSRTMVLELHVARLDGLLAGATAEDRFLSFLERLRQTDVALDLLREYPVLARQLVLRLNQWVDFTLDFLRHLAADWDAVSATFSQAESLGAIVDVRCGAGDGHRGGRSVLIVKFSSGAQVVYKPRALTVDVHFQELLAWLNSRGEHPPFGILRVLDRGDHGWVEFVAAEDCTSPEEVRRFYERQGAYLALLYALEATDFHAENLVAAGEHPVLLDLEALFHPRAGGTDLRRAEEIAGSTIGNSVARVGLLPQFSWSDGEHEGVDLSGLGALPGQLTPRTVPQWEESGTDEMHHVRKRVEIPDGHNRPRLCGAEVNVLDYADAIEAGFTSLYHCLLTHRDELLAEDGILAQFENDEVRVILRATYTYGSLLQESFHPDVLRDALDRDRLFDRLWTAVEYFPHLARVIRAERADLERGDIPIFTTRPGSRDLWTSSHESIPDFFEEAGMALARRRIEQLSEPGCARQIWFIRASLAMLSTGPGPVGQRPSREVVATTEASRSRLVAAACAVGDHLEELASRGQNDVAWIGLTSADQQRWSLVPLGLDLYDGLPGVALFLAHLGEVAGEVRYTELARAALVSVRALRKTGHVLGAGMGGFGGLGGVIYALTHLGLLWDDAELLCEAEEVVELVPPLIAQDEHLDIIGGAAGCIAALAGLYRSVRSSHALAAAIQCGDHLVARAAPQQYGLGWISRVAKERPLAGLSHGAAGFAWALLELAALSGEERFRTTALASIEYERSLFSPETRNWLDLRPALQGKTNAAGDQSIVAWCHGAPGIGLARLLGLHQLDNDDIRSEIGAALETTLARGFGYNHCLCHGDLGNTDWLLEASARLGEPRWCSEANRLAATVLASIEKNGWICGNPLQVESPGLMTGLAGIGYGLLRLAEPTLVPSVLAMALPNQTSAKIQSSADEVRASV